MLGGNGVRGIVRLVSGCMYLNRWDIFRGVGELGIGDMTVRDGGVGSSGELLLIRGCC